MKNKVFNYVLLAAVLVLWGVIIYRVVGSGDDDSLSSSPVREIVRTQKKEVIASQDTFILLANYRDPFLGSVYNARSVSNFGKVRRHVKKKEVAPPPPPKPTLDWSFAKYSGMIKSKGKNIAILHLRDKEYMIAAGETAGQVLVHTITRDSVELEYTSERKYIRKAR